MSAQLKPVELTEKERQDAKRELFEQKRKDALYVLDALNTFHDWHAFYAARDMLPCQSEMDRALWRLLEKDGSFAEAELEAEGLKYLEGKL
jgi:hypothetical protein